MFLKFRTPKKSLWQWVRRPHSCTALQWWHQRQVARLHDGAELIRDGLLQDLVAVRRQLELTQVELAQQASAHRASGRANDAIETIPEKTLPNQLQESIQQLEALHLRLETVSNTLSPAFRQDSLALAVQHSIQRWQTKHPTIAIASHFAPDQQEPPHQIASDVGLTTVEEWLTLVTPHLSPNASLKVRVESRRTANRTDLDGTELEEPKQGIWLSLALHEPDPTQRNAIAHLSELTYLCRSVYCLTGKPFSHRREGSTLSWHLCLSLMQS